MEVVLATGVEAAEVARPAPPERASWAREPAVAAEPAGPAGLVVLLLSKAERVALV
jgi:hypothetical protein